MSKNEKNARANHAKILFFIVKYANLWGFSCRRRRGCLSSLMFLNPGTGRSSECYYPELDCRILLNSLSINHRNVNAVRPERFQPVQGVIGRSLLYQAPGYWGAQHESPKWREQFVFFSPFKCLALCTKDYNKSPITDPCLAGFSGRYRAPIISHLFYWFKKVKYIKMHMKRKFFSKLVRTSFQDAEKWRLFYSDSTLGCRIIQDFYMCKLDDL